MNGAPSRPLGLLVKRFPKLSETFVLEEVLGLERLGVPLRLYTLAAPSDTLAHPAVERVQAPLLQVPARWTADPLAFAGRHLRLAAIHPLRYAHTLVQALRRGRAGWADFLRAGWLAGQLRADGVQHLHTHFVNEPADLALLSAQMGGVPFSLSAHAKDIYRSEPAALRRKLDAAQFTVTCTEFNCRALRALAPQRPVLRMYHGIDGSAFHPSRRAAPALVPRLLSVGRLVPKKGLDVLLQACTLLAARGQSFSLEIVGYGSELAPLQALADTLGLQGQVRFAGALTREHVIDRYARASVYVQPSRVAADGDRDGIPNVLLEAMAMGLPAVATQVSGIPEVLQHRVNGLLVPPDDPAALADAIGTLLAEPALAAALARAARGTVTEHFDNDRNLRVVLQLLEDSHAHGTECATA